MKKSRTFIQPRVKLQPSSFAVWLKLCWMFLKVKLISTSGPASVGLLYKYAVGDIMTEAQFVEAVGFSNVLPGSEALKLAMFVGFAALGIPGALTALIGSILPPALSMFVVALVVQNFEDASWMNGFINGMLPAVAMLITVAAWKLFQTDKKIRKRPLLIAALSLIALLLNAPPPLVLLGAGVFGIFLFR